MLKSVATFSGIALKIAGWRVQGQLPDRKKFILIIAPHTSNWDFIWGLLLGLHWQVIGKTIWFGKHTMFVGWMGRLFRWLGGVPIDRSQPHHVVEQTIAALSSRDELILALAPEGTRHRTDHWKSGFYLIALKSKLPVAMAFINYRDKCLGLGPILECSGNAEQDWAQIRNFYQKDWAKYPEFFSEIRQQRGGDGPHSADL